MSRLVLIVDDDAAMCDVLAASLNDRGYDPVVAHNADDALMALTRQEFDAVVTDMSMHGMGGFELCDRVLAGHPGVPVVVITAFGSLDTAVAALRVGATDFLTKPFDPDQLGMTLDRAIQLRHLQEEVKRLRQAVPESRRFKALVGESRAMQKVYDLVERIAESDSYVLIIGETGTGKELIARALHDRSRRADAPFVALNCAAMPEALLETELFGHTRGAFTDAKTTRRGLFAEADHGTLFLDEVAALPTSLQANLLQVLQDRKARAVGSDHEVEVDIRVIAATNSDLEQAVERNAFRKDLYFRLNVVPINVPPLRLRGNDILLLGQHFINLFAQKSGKKVRGLSGPAAKSLTAYNWPGNVRELQNCIERAVTLAAYEEITVEDLPERIRQFKPSRGLVLGEDPAELVSMAEVEKRYILRVMDAVGGNKTLASQVLGLDRKTLYRKLEQYSFEHSRG